MTSTDRRVPGNEAVIEAIEGHLDSHIDEYHAFKAEDLRVMVEEHRELYDDVAPLARDTNLKVTLIVDEMYGTPHPTAVDPEARLTDGWAPVLRELMEDGTFTIKRKWSQGQWAFYGSIGASVIAACTAIVVSVIAG